MLTSILPGRIRARLSPDFPEHALDALRDALAKAASGVEVTFNPRSRSLLITYPPGPKRDLAVRRTLDAHVVAPKPSAAKKTLNWPSMRTVKRGMIVSLGVALASVALRGERVHIWTGGVFTACLARHLYVYRKRLLK